MTVELEHFKNIGSQKVALGPLRVLVGRNGAGKSNFIDALRFLRDCLAFGIDSAVMRRGGIGAIRQWSPYKPYASVALCVEGREAETRWRYRLELGGKGGEYHVRRETFMAGGAEDTVLPHAFDVEQTNWRIRPEGVVPELGERTLVLPLLSAQPLYRHAVRTLTNMDFYSIYPDVLREPQRPFEGSRLEEKGINLASVLRRMQQDAPERLDTIAEELSRIVDNVDHIRTRQVGGRIVIELHHPAPKKAHWMEAAQQSDGTLRVLGLLVSLYQAPPPSLVAVEEPELTLHPGAMGLLCDSFIEASRSTQILLTTHSPDLISRFDADDLLVVESIDGEAQIGPIDETQREAVEEQLFSAGDLLRLNGGLRRETAAGRAD
ncbi:MAG: AAA family ATPase [Armatimonadota bacterium]